MPKKSKPTSVPRTKKTATRRPKKTVPQRSGAAAKRSSRGKFLPLPRSGGRVLVLECDAQTLRADGFTIASKLYDAARTTADDTKVRHLPVNSKLELLKSLGEVAVDLGTFEVIVIVGHSNRTGIRLASDLSVEWSVLGSWLKALNPRKLVLIACEAGRWMPANALFKTLPRLNEIYGSPLLVGEDHARLLYALVPFLAAGVSISPQGADFFKIGQVVNFVVSKGGVILRHTRAEFARTGVEEAQHWDALADVGEILRTLFPL